MREVSPGDIIFSSRDTRIAALGIARSYCHKRPKPTEVGTAGNYWEAIGWESIRIVGPAEKHGWHRRGYADGTSGNTDRYCDSYPDRPRPADYDRLIAGGL